MTTHSEGKGISAWLGHASMAITLNTYSQVLPTLQEESAVGTLKQVKDSLIQMLFTGQTGVKAGQERSK